jgi:hypothetical protein
MASLWLNHPGLEGEEIPDIVGHDGSDSKDHYIVNIDALCHHTGRSRIARLIARDY